MGLKYAIDKSCIIRAGTTCTVHAFSHTVHSGLPSLELTQHVLCKITVRAFSFQRHCIGGNRDMRVQRSIKGNIFYNRFHCVHCTTGVHDQ